MRTGLILDNCQTALGQDVDPHSYEKLAAMGARAVGLLWTGGTRHDHRVYERCEALLDHPLYILRIGGHHQTPSEWVEWAQQALAEVPDAVLFGGRVLLSCGNEPNVEGYVDDPSGYGRLYAAVSDLSIPVLFACPSLGVPGWERYLETALAQVRYPPRRLIVNLYDYNVSQIAVFTELAPEVYVGEVNTLPAPGLDRPAWIRSAFDTLNMAGVKAALVFIANGEGVGWPAGYIVSEQEASSFRWIPKEVGMDEATQTALIEMEARQNAHITEALIAILRGDLWEGADSVAGQVIALTAKTLDELGLTPPK